ncbi:MAG TPA: anti-sigma factor [Burkholderiales bacterium]|nr:anti-sigma factor [Burkholderiales bacterium]
MRYRNKPELQDRLAAEYVLGTLRGRARLRFQSWMREDAALRRTVAEWEQRLAPLAAAVAEVAPPRRVWKAIEARIGPTAAARPAPAAAPAQPAAPRAMGGGFWENLTFWRGWGLVATGCAAALIGALALQKPEVVEVPVEKLVERTGMQPSYVAVLRDKAGKAVFVAYAGRKSDELWVKRIGIEAEPPEHGYELWGLYGKEGAAPKLLGMLPKDDKGTIRLAAVADESLKDFPALAITLEPARGSGGAPTGPVVASGDCFKFW